MRDGGYNAKRRDVGRPTDNIQTKQKANHWDAGVILVLDSHDTINAI